MRCFLVCFLFCGAVLKYLPVSPVSDEGIPLLFMHDEYQLFQQLFPTTLLRAEELRQRAAVLDLFLTGCIASTVVMELPGHRAAELPPCTSVDAHLNPHCLLTASAPCACRQEGMSREWLNSDTPHGSLDRNSNFCTTIKQKRKRSAVMWSKLWTEIQHKYHRKK